MESSMEIPQKANNDHFWALGIYSKELKSGYDRDTCTLM
jgi:hypothetical protein